MNANDGIEIELLMTLRIDVKRSCYVPGTPLGDRVVFDVLGGSFEGAGLKGRVLPSGGDWVTRTAAGSHLSVRLLLQTDDGVTIPFSYVGRASQKDGEPRIEVAGSFEAPSGAYGWLNDLQVFGRGSAIPEAVVYRMFRFK